MLSFVPQNYVDTACTNANSWFILNPLAHSNRIMLLSIRNCWVWNSLRQFQQVCGLAGMKSVKWPLGAVSCKQANPKLFIPMLCAGRNCKQSILLLVEALWVANESDRGDN